jgi:hypothetical protein
MYEEAMLKAPTPKSAWSWVRDRGAVPPSHETITIDSSPPATAAPSPAGRRRNASPRDDDTNPTVMMAVIEKNTDG